VEEEEEEGDQAVGHPTVAHPTEGHLIADLLIQAAILIIQPMATMAAITVTIIQILNRLLGQELVGQYLFAFSWRSYSLS
jgi:hypothetical protein